MTETRTYVTEVWCPPVDDGIQRLHSPMREPEPEPEPAIELESGGDMTRGDFPVGGSLEAVAKWFGFASVAELEASHEQYAEEMTAEAIAEELADPEAAL